jgi:hypothetical protein
MYIYVDIDMLLIDDVLSPLKIRKDASTEESNCGTPTGRQLYAPISSSSSSSSSSSISYPQPPSSPRENINSPKNTISSPKETINSSEEKIDSPKEKINACKCV